MDKPGYVYILANKRNGTLYIGVTSNLVRRIWQHRNSDVQGFTSKYGCKTLVYFESYNQIQNAIRREKAMKEWKRAWKVQLIQRNNPNWRDLWDDIASP